MMVGSAEAWVATWPPTLGLPSSSSVTSWNSYLFLGLALCSFTASSAELRPPMPSAETEPVSGARKAILTTSFAPAAGDSAISAAAIKPATRPLYSRFMTISSSVPSWKGAETGLPRQPRHRTFSCGSGAQFRGTGHLGRGTRAPAAMLAHRVREAIEGHRIDRDRGQVRLVLDSRLLVLDRRADFRAEALELRQQERCRALG